MGSATDAAAIGARRLAAQLLSGPPAGDPLAVARRLLATQAQDPRGARLAIRARSAGFAASRVDRALSEERSLVVSWLNRGTLHLVAAEDYPWLHLLTAPTQRTSVSRRLAQERVEPGDAERAVGLIERALADAGPLTRAQLRERLDAAGIPTAGQAMVQLLAAATLEGSIVRGPMVGREQAFALVRDWLGEPEPIDRDRALAELARRYLRGHGPASDRDLARWAGLPLRDARRGLDLIAGELVETGHGLVDLPPDSEVPPLPPPRLLGAFEPVLLGWTSRESIVGTHAIVLAVNGLFRPFALVDGRATATWSMPRGRVSLEPLVPLTREVVDALEDEAAAVERFLRD